SCQQSLLSKRKMGIVWRIDNNQFYIIIRKNGLYAIVTDDLRIICMSHLLRSFDHSPKLKKITLVYKRRMEHPPGHSIRQNTCYDRFDSHPLLMVMCMRVFLTTDLCVQFAHGRQYV